MNKNRKKLSKHISFLLRHKPEQGNLTLDSRGFVHVKDLLTALNTNLKFPTTKSDLEELIIPSEDPSMKTRFIIEGNYIRAGHGHSVLIADYEEIIPTENPYHATPYKNVGVILATGLKAMNRDKVHLSYDKAITFEAAKRRSGNVALLMISCTKAHEVGVKFYSSADDRIVLSDDLPPSCLSLMLE